jgi:hypothetical protein
MPTLPRRLMLAHLADRPSWDCLSCGLPWPCAQARGRLLAEYLYDPKGLRLYLGQTLVEAVSDLARQDGFVVAGLWNRFGAWAGSFESDDPPAWVPDRSIKT